MASSCVQKKNHKERKGGRKRKQQWKKRNKGKNIEERWQKMSIYFEVPFRYAFAQFLSKSHPKYKGQPNFCFNILCSVWNVILWHRHQLLEKIK